MHKAAAQFAHKYKKYIHRQEEVEREPPTAQDMKEECQSGSQSAAGPYGFEPSEMAVLHIDAHSEIAKLLNNVERGAQWPQSMTTARAALMQKDILCNSKRM